MGRRLLAEFLGTGLLVAVVVGSGIAAQQFSPDDAGLQLLENSIATALGLAVLILMFGPVSGAHFSGLAAAAGCGFTAWPTAPSVATIDDLTAQIRAFEHGPPWRRIAAVRDRVLVAPIPQYAADVVEVAGRERADVVLCEGVPGIVVGALATAVRLWC